MNTKLASRHGAATLLALCLAMTIAACGARLTAEERVDLARSQLAEGDAAAAAIHLRNVLQDDPSNVPARTLLAESALQVGDIETAVKEFRRALDLGAELDDIRAEYAEALVRGGALDNALRVTDPEEAGDETGIAYWRATALVRTGRPDEAEALFERIAQEPAMRVRAHVGLARVAIVRQQPEQALAILDRVSGEAADLSDYWETVANAAMESGQPARAAAAFARAAGTVVDAGGTQRFLYLGREVEVLLAAGQLADARSRAEQLHQRAREHPYSNYLMGRVELQAGNPQQALAYGQAMLAARPNSSRGHLLIGMAQLALEQVVQAERSLERAVAADPADMVARRMLAQTRLGMQAPERALEALGPITDPSLDPGMATLAGVASVRAGDPDAAIDIFRRQLARDPRDDEARSMLAVSLMAAGRVEEALAELAQISGSDGAVRQRADLIEVAAHLQAGSHDEARDTAARLAAAHPEDAGLRVNLGGLFLSGNHVEEASTWLEEGVRLDPANAAAHFNLGRIAAAMGQLDQARGHFDTIVGIDPSNGAALSGLAQLDWAAGEREAAVERLQKARAAEPRDLSTRLLLAGYLADMDRSGESREVAEEAVAIAPESATAANALGLAWLQTGNAREALREFARAHRITPGTPEYLINQARAEVALVQLEAARQTLVQALALDPESLRGLAMMVTVERRRGRLDGAARTFAQLEQAAAAGDGRVEVIRGELLLAQEDHAGAERAFAAAMEAGVGSSAAIGIYHARRRAGAASPDEPLLDWLRAQSGDTRVRTLLATHYMETRDYPAAIEQHEKLLEANPDNPVTLNNAAWLYNEIGDPRAVEMAERAHHLAPDNPMVADTFGWILHQHGESARALELISRAARDAPQVGEIQYHHAVVLAETGDKSGAVREARQLLGDAGAAKFHDAAQKLLVRLEQGKD